MFPVDPGSVLSTTELLVHPVLVAKYPRSIYHTSFAVTIIEIIAPPTPVHDILGVVLVGLVCADLNSYSDHHFLLYQGRLSKLLIKES